MCKSFIWGIPVKEEEAGSGRKVSRSKHRQDTFEERG
jgi:hypothetical protein